MMIDHVSGLVTHTPYPGDNEQKTVLQVMRPRYPQLIRYLEELVPIFGIRDDIITAGHPSYESFTYNGAVFTKDTTPEDIVHEVAHIIAAPPKYRKLVNCGLSDRDEEKSGNEEITTCYIQYYMLSVLGMSYARLTELANDYAFKNTGQEMAAFGRSYLKRNRKKVFATVQQWKRCLPNN